MTAQNTWTQPIQRHPMAEMRKTNYPDVAFMFYVYKKMKQYTHNHMWVTKIWITDFFLKKQ